MLPAIQFNLLQTVVIIAIPLLFAITLHEMAHGWMANRLGDPTAKMLGRITLNPLKHIDPVGTLIVPAATMMLGGLLFGWAKPVPITWRNLKHKRRDGALVALAGPVANLSMALWWGIIAWIGYQLINHQLMAGIGFAAMGKMGIQLNCMLFILNLLPLPSLDGGHILSALLPPRWAYYYDKASPYGLFILLGLWFLHILPLLLYPPLEFLIEGIKTLFQLP